MYILNAFVWIAILFLTFSFLRVVWLRLPTLLMARQPDLIRLAFIEPSESKSFATISPQLEAILAEFRTLGFTPLGVKLEKLPLWGPQFEEYSLASSPAQVFASLLDFRNLRYRGFYLFTPFTGGQIVFTTTNPNMPAQDLPDFSLHVMANATPTQALADHQDRVRQFQARGLQPYAGYTRESRLAATRLFYHAPAISRQQKARAGAFLLGLLLPLALIVGLLIWNLSR
ncbi:MAG: hypothetical protein WCF84_07410 [Anaerolineae bacterium]